MEEQSRAEEHDAMAPDDAAFDEILAGLPLTTYHAGETVLSAGLKTARLLFLKQGAVAILKDSIEVARVEQPGAVFGEVAALLNQPHTADVRALEDSQFYVADAALLGEGPIALLHIARILAQRLVATDAGLVELKKQLQGGQSPSALSKMLAKVEQILNVGPAAQWV